MTPFSMSPCPQCHAEFNTEDQKFRHADDCPLGKPRPVVSLAAARFDKVDKPCDMSARDALEAALKHFDEADPKPTHIIVLVGRDSPASKGGSDSTYFQAGNYRYHAQLGLCLEGIDMLQGSPDD